MNDLIFIRITLAFFAARALCVRFCKRLQGVHMETVVTAVVALLLFIYLFVAMLRPEAF